MWRLSPSRVFCHQNFRLAPLTFSRTAPHPRLPHLLKTRNVRDARGLPRKKPALKQPRGLAGGAGATGRELLKEAISFPPAAGVPQGHLECPPPDAARGPAQQGGEGAGGHTLVRWPGCRAHGGTLFIRTPQPPGCRSNFCSQKGLHAARGPSVSQTVSVWTVCWDSSTG